MGWGLLNDRLNGAWFGQIFNLVFDLYPRLYPLLRAHNCSSLEPKSTLQKHNTEWRHSVAVHWLRWVFEELKLSPPRITKEGL